MKLTIDNRKFACRDACIIKIEGEIKQSEALKKS
jgi:hypothetical protein